MFHNMSYANQRAGDAALVPRITRPLVPAQADRSANVNAPLRLTFSGLRRPLRPAVSGARISAIPDMAAATPDDGWSTARRLPGIWRVERGLGGTRVRPAGCLTAGSDVRSMGPIGRATAPHPTSAAPEARQSSCRLQGMSNARPRSRSLTAGRQEGPARGSGGARKRRAISLRRGTADLVANGSLHAARRVAGSARCGDRALPLEWDQNRPKR